jgi:hypothetical protein
MILVTFLKELVSIVLNQVAICGWCVVILTFVGLEVVLVGVVRE